MGAAWGRIFMWKVSFLAIIWVILNEMDNISYEGSSSLEESLVDKVKI